MCGSHLVLPFVDSLVTEVLPLLASFCIFLDRVFLSLVLAHYLNYVHSIIYQGGLCQVEPDYVCVLLAQAFSGQKQGHFATIGVGKDHW